MKARWVVTAAAVLAPAAMSAQADTTRGHAMRGDHAAGQHGRMAQHGRHGGNYGLTTDQIRQLQQALADAGCDPGAVDGVMGAKTHHALACARQKNSVTGNNVNELLRSLNLTFTVEDSTGMGGMMGGADRHAGGHEAMHGDSAMHVQDTSDIQRMRGAMGRTKARNRGAAGARRDTTRRPPPTPR